MVFPLCQRGSSNLVSLFAIVDSAIVSLGCSWLPCG